LFVAALALLTAVLGVMTVLQGLPALLGRRALSASEFWLVLAVVCGTLLTPGALLVRWFRRRFWNNSVKMLEFLPRLRGPIVGALASYGIVVLFGRSADAVAQHVGASGPGYSGWPGFAPIHVLIALTAGTTIFLRRRILESDIGRFGRLFAGPVLAVAAIAVSIACLHLGQRARARGVAPPPLAAAVPSAEPSVVPTATAAGDPDPPAAPLAMLPSPSPGIAPGPQASADDVRAASARGVEGLLELSKRFPGDPAVIEPLVIALGATAEGLPRAMSELDTLLRIDPERGRDKTVGALVVKAALSPGEASTRALDLMGTRMGSLGPDMLYDLMLTSIPLRQAARERLDDAAVRKQFSPALAVAFELRTARTCAERVPLLRRALETGDARAVSTLIGLSTAAKRGCGPKKKHACPAGCPTEAAHFRATALELQRKLNAKKR
jgi:hypothetical protein